ncbi:MAG: cob(I)yrinic acid a,c-diamide adenosyltransferase [Rhodospirillales bacterium]|jgi:cob(I)alamin adenosyltransferase|nr:cob(I)yrinic acid a,c-diamide adenosyltransferase [Rhodospirillales bacterium]MDP6804054.1 cob(I)yrinic acid a,c-diamide adenosyltransferase [Rhodospirillales bacterium]
MVRLTRIYTRGGDAGQTSLGGGRRVAKHDLRVEAFGTVDEANAAIGLARLEAEGEADEMLARIQNDLFDLGADLCTPEGGARADQALRVSQAQVRRLEAEIDGLNASLAPLDSFVLPGGSEAAARLHVARTVVRRAERLIAALGERESVNADALVYANRLSDHLFVLARTLNEEGRRDVLWTPGANR